MSGYDSAQRLKKDDDLGRWRFAAEIAEVIRSTPADWSARIGIFGKWGEGKSTVLHFLEEMLRPEGHIVFTFTPWAVQDLEELWSEFGKALLEVLEREKLAVESPWKEAARKVQQKLNPTGLAEAGEAAAELFGKDKLYKGALGLVGKWLKPDGTQIRKIRKELGERRVVAFIDDLDRATPELLPKLLLSLREILDLPGFTFVLAFDNEIVADGLVTSNKAWGDGDSFLDKILDFHYYLPPVSKANKRRLLEHMLSRYAKFVPLDSVGPVEHLLPDNPRKLKRLIRGLVSLQRQVERHGADELNWVEIWLAEMIRQESYPFFLRLMDDKALDSLIGMGYRIRMNRRKGTGGDVEPIDDAEILKVIESVGGVNGLQRARLIELVNATRSLAGFRLQYSWRFALRPEAVTWKEFYELLAQWRKAAHAETIGRWVAKQSTQNSIDVSDIEAELFETLLNAKHTAASKAAETSSAEDNEVHCAEATELLRMTEQFLGQPGMLTPERFGELYGKSLYWIAFRVNPADAMLRDAEQNLLLSLLEKAPDDDSPAILETLKPWDPWEFVPESSEFTHLKKALRAECTKRLIPKVVRAFATYIKRPESLRLLSTSEGSEAFRYILFSEDQSPWAPTVRTALLGAIKDAKNIPDAYEKANDFLNLLADGAANRTNYLSRQNAERVAHDRDFMRALWREATSKHIQFRMLNSYVKKRQALIDIGASAEDLALSPELAAAAKVTSTVGETSSAGGIPVTPYLLQP